MGDVINIFGNELGYAHIVCKQCDNDSFHMRVEEDEKGVYYFHFLVCCKCGNEIPVDIKPVFKKDGETFNDEDEGK